MTLVGRFLTDLTHRARRHGPHAAFAGVFFAGLMVAGFALAGGEAVSLTGTGPNPGRVAVTWGDTVTFVNNDGDSVVLTSQRPEFTGATLGPGGSHEIAFEGRAGGYPYKEIVGKRSFAGSVVVSASGSVTLIGTA